MEENMHMNTGILRGQNRTWMGGCPGAEDREVQAVVSH